MRARSRTDVLIDLMTDVDDAALVARAAVKLGFRLRIDSDPRNYSEEVAEGVAVLDHADYAFLDEELTRLVVLWALAENEPPARALDRIRQKLEAMPLDLDKSPRESLTTPPND